MIEGVHMVENVDKRNELLLLENAGSYDVNGNIEE